LSLEDSLKLIVADKKQIVSQQISYCQPQIPVISQVTGKNANHEVDLEEDKYLVEINAEQSNWQQLMVRLAELYAAGLSVDWLTVNQRGRKLELPTYPFQRQRYAI